MYIDEGWPNKITMLLLCSLTLASAAWGQELFPMPTPADFERQYGEFTDFGWKLGMHLQEKLLDAGRTNLSTTEKVDILFAKIDEIADSYGMTANINESGRAKMRARAPSDAGRFNCGWWSFHIIKALNAMDVKGHLAVNSEGGGSSKGVNTGHQAVMYIDEQQNLIVCDIWQHGVDQRRGVGLVSIRGFPQSSRRAMKYKEWRELQIQETRTRMTFQRIAKPLRESDFFNGIWVRARRKLGEKYRPTIKVDKLFGSFEKYWQVVAEILEEMILEKSTVSDKVLEELFEKKVQEELKKKTLVPQLFGLPPADANDALQDADLRPGRLTKTPIDVNDLDMANKVYNQKPVSDENYVLRKEAVDYWYYSPPPLRPVPGLLGVTPGEADRRIKTALFTIGDRVKLPPDANFPTLHGRVVTQSFPEGTMKPAGTKISYEWRPPDGSKRWVPIPSLRGKTPGAADGHIRTAGFQVGAPTQSPYNPQEPNLAGLVYAQSASGTAEVGMEISYFYYDVAPAATTSGTGTSPGSTSAHDPGGLMIKMAGGERRIFAGDTPVFEAWDKSGLRRYPPASVEWVHSDETTLPVAPHTGQGRALKAGDVMIMAKREGAWPAFKDITVWDRAPTLVGMTLAQAEKLMERKALSLQLANPLQKHAEGARIRQQTPTPNTPVNATTPIEVTLSLAAQDADASPPGTIGDGANYDGPPAPGTGPATATDTDTDTEGDGDTQTGTQVTVPSVGGLPADRAKALISAAGLIPAVQNGDAAAEKAQEFTVQSQSPAGGTPALRWDAVTVVVYGTYSEPVRTIPNVVGMPAARAKETLESAGLTVSMAGGKPAPQKELSFTVFQQVPAAGLSETPVSSVTLTLYSEYSDEVPVPTVAGLSREEAEALIRDQGLMADVVWGDAAPSRDQLGRVQAQQPSPGEMQSRGATVKVYIYAAVVPALQGLTAAQAEAAINGAWLNPRLFWGDEIKNRTLWKTVQSQSPAAGTKVAAASDVTARIYREPREEEAPYKALLGRWRGQYITGRPDGRKDPMIFDVLSVDDSGAFEAHLQWPSYDEGRGATTLVRGTVQGTNITFRELKILKGKGVWTGTNKYVGTWSQSEGRIRGTYHYNWDNEWSSGRDFWLGKED